MITTKKGTARKGIGVSLSAGTDISVKLTRRLYQKCKKSMVEVMEHIMKIQSGYFYASRPEWRRSGELIVPTSEDASWGAKFDPESYGN